MKERFQNDQHRSVMYDIQSCHVAGGLTKLLLVSVGFRSGLLAYFVFWRMLKPSVRSFISSVPVLPLLYGAKSEATWVCR